MPGTPLPRVPTQSRPQMLGTQHCIAWSDTAALCAGPLQHGAHLLHRRLHICYARASGPERDPPGHRHLHHYHAPCPGAPLLPDKPWRTCPPLSCWHLEWRRLWGCACAALGLGQK